jgi:hypothetical protein
VNTSDEDPSNQLLGSSITYRIALGPLDFISRLVLIFCDGVWWSDQLLSKGVIKKQKMGLYPR